jgi:hypothetical protein
MIPRSVISVVLGVVSLFFAAAVIAQTLPPAECDLQCEREAATWLIEHGQPRAAVERLREAIDRFPDDRQLALLLARGYLVEGNLFWAERTLGDALDRRPDDVEIRSWLASVHLRQGDPDLAQADLQSGTVPQDGPTRARWMLLEAMRARLADDDEAFRSALAQASSSGSLFSEDRPTWRLLRRRADPWWFEPIIGTLELSAGGTSNALAGSPTDPGESGDASGLGRLELHSRFAPPSSGRLRPALDLDVVGHGLEEEAYRELSNLQGSIRLGGLLATRGHRLFVGARAEVLLLDQSPSRYSDAYRVEGELEGASGWVVFGGAGRRSYRDDRRTRWEGDAGFGGPLRLHRSVPVVAGAVVRVADANSPAYDQLGVSVAASAQIVLGSGWTARLAGTVAWEDYPNSGGLEGLLVFGTADKRRDLLGRISFGAWAPAWHGLLPGVECQFARRDSSADERPGYDFSYDELRVVALVRWSFAGDPWAPRAVRDPDHVPLEWGLETKRGLGEERILDLLRQDEELRRGSSCGVR